MIIPRPYVYKLWNGKQVVGTLSLAYRIQGTHVVIVFEPTILKQVYGKKYEHIRCPLFLQTYDDGVTITTERMIDVRRKSQRQIALLQSYS